MTQNRELFTAQTHWVSIYLRNACKFSNCQMEWGRNNHSHKLSSVDKNIWTRPLLENQRQAQKKEHGILGGGNDDDVHNIMHKRRYDTAYLATYGTTWMMKVLCKMEKSCNILNLLSCQLQLSFGYPPLTINVIIKSLSTACAFIGIIGSMHSTKTHKTSRSEFLVVYNVHDYYSCTLINLNLSHWMPNTNHHSIPETRDCEPQSQ